MNKLLRVLIIEDSEDDTLLLLRELRRGGFEPKFERVDTPEGMLAALDEHTWDIVISDYVMPYFSGLAALELLKQRKSVLPFIIVSGKIGEEVAVEAMKAGAHDYILKGNLARLVPAIERELREAEVRREQKRAEQELLLSEERFSKAFNASAVIMSIISLENGRYVDVNESFLRYTGYNREEVVSHTVKELDIFSWGTCVKLKQRLLAASSAQDMEINFYTKNGKARIGLASADMIYVNGLQCCLLVMQDITERRQLENEMIRLERLNVIGQMAAGIGHEVRNPMTTVRGFLQMLEGKRECYRYKEYFNLMIEELDRANSIIGEFLSVARNKETDFKMQCLNSIVESLLPLMQADAIASDIYIKAELAHIPNLLVDEKEIRQLILNLVRNGLESMKSGGFLTISTFSDNGGVALSVQDQGEGIPPDILNKLGRPFFTTKESGTGLGLAVCYGIAGRHNAIIDIKTGSEGTIFFVRFRQKKNINDELKSHPRKSVSGLTFI